MSPSRAPAPTPPAVVSVFERCGTNVTRSGKVSESVDKHLGRKALVVDGDVPAAHFVRLPKVGKPGLRLAGAYAYLQVRLDPARFYTAHIDIVCVDRARPTRSDASVDYQMGRKVVRISVSNLYRSRAGSAARRKEAPVGVGGFGAVCHHLQPPHAGWFCVRVDARASLRDALERGELGGDAARLTFESIKSFQIGGAVAVRDVLVGAAPFDEESAPAEARASTKPDATLTWLDAGPVDERRDARDATTTIDDRGAIETEPEPRRAGAAAPAARAAGIGTAVLREDVATLETREKSSRARATDPADASEPTARVSAASAPPVVTDAFEPTATALASRAAAEDPALRLRAVIGASCETRASLSATRGGVVAHAADRAVVVRYLNDPESEPQVLLDHAEAVSCVAFSADGDALATAQKGAFPSVFVYRRARDAARASAIDEHFEHFARVASLRASCASAVSLALARREGVTRLALLGDTPAGSSRAASIELWDAPGFGCSGADETGESTRDGDAASPVKILAHALRETTRATCVAFAPDRDDRLFACGDGFVTEATLVLDRTSRTSAPATLIEKPVRFDDLDLAALRGDASSNEARAFTTLAFLRGAEKKRDADDADGRGNTGARLFVGTASGAVVSMTVRDDDDDSGDAACAPECAFQLHAGAVTALDFFVPDDAPDEDDGSDAFASSRRDARPLALAATASADGTTRVWPADFSTAHLLEVAHDAPARVVAAAFSRRERREADPGDPGALVVTATSDGAIGCLDLSNRRHAFLTTSPSRSATASGARAVASLSAAASAAGPAVRVVCAACDDGAARGWDAATGALVFECVPPPGSRDDEDDVAATSVCFRRRRANEPESDALAVGYASGAVRVFSIAPAAREGGAEAAPKPRQTRLVAEILDAHALGAAVDAVVFAGREVDAGRATSASARTLNPNPNPRPALFSAARDGTLCAIESDVATARASDSGAAPRETFSATRRVRVAAAGARAAATASPCGGYVLVAASAGALGAAATGGSRSSSHVLAFDADTLALRPPAMRSHRGGVAGIAAARFAPREDGAKGGAETAFSVFVAGDDVAAVLSRHAFPDVASRDDARNADGALSASSLVRTAAEPEAVTRATHAPTRAPPDGKRNAAVAATLGVAVDPTRRVVVTCGADGTVLVAPANAGHDPAEVRRRDGDASHCQRFVTAHAGAVRGAAFLSTDEAAAAPPERPGDCLLATVGEGRVLCVWDVRAAALAALESRASRAACRGPAGAGPGDDAIAADDDGTRIRAFGLARRRAGHPSEGPTRAEMASGETGGPGDASVSVARRAPTSAGYARASPEPWTRRDPTSFPDENVFVAVPSRTVGVAVGAAAAAAARTENAAAVAAAAAAPGALYAPELGALMYAAGARVVIERVGGDKTQAFLGPIGGEGDVTALARHADTRRLAASAPSLTNEDDATIRVWDSGTGAPLFTATHASCGGAVSVLAFSPSGNHLLSLGQDPEGAIRVFSLGLGSEETRRGGVEAVPPPVPPPVPALALAAAAPVASGAWLSDRAFFVVGASGATAYRFGVAPKDGPGGDAAPDVRAVPFRFEDERGDALDPAPVCTAAAALEAGDANRRAEAFAGDSRGRVWVARGDFGADGAVGESAVGESARTERLAFRMLRATAEGAPLDALPRGEAATAMAAFADATGRGVFVGSARRARVLFSEHPNLPSRGARGPPGASPEAKAVAADVSAAVAADASARGWYELGELALDGAVTSSHSTTFPTDASGGSSGWTAARRLRRGAKTVTATTSAGTVWSVDTRAGVAKALARAHAVDVSDVTAFEDALATVTVDGAARIWDGVSFARAAELFPESADAPRCVTSAVCGERVCFARDDGTVRALDLATPAAASPGDGDVVASNAYAFAAHPNGGAVVAAAFAESLRGGASDAQVPLVSVATDGSVAVTEFFRDDATDARRDASAKTKTKTTVVVPGGPGGVLPVRAAALEGGVFPARVAAARDDAVRVFSLRRTAAGETASPADDSDHPRFVASSTFEHAPVRAEGFGRRGSSPGGSACVAWSAANAGVLYYAGAATGGELLVLDAKRARGDGGDAAEARTSVVELPTPDRDDSCPRRARCVAVTNRRGAAGDLVAVGGDDGCVFFELAARETAGFVSDDRRRETVAPTRVSIFESPKPVVAVDWRESRETKTAFLAAGADIHAFDDDALFRR